MKKIILMMTLFVAILAIGCKAEKDEEPITLVTLADREGTYTGVKSGTTSIVVTVGAEVSGNVPITFSPGNTQSFAASSTQTSFTNTEVTGDKPYVAFLPNTDDKDLNFVTGNPPITVLCRRP